jgi:hypothetical protein
MYGTEQTGGCCVDAGLRTVLRFISLARSDLIFARAEPQPAYVLLYVRTPHHLFLRSALLLWLAR